VGFVAILGSLPVIEAIAARPLTVSIVIFLVLIAAIALRKVPALRSRPGLLCLGVCGALTVLLGPMVFDAGPLPPADSWKRANDIRELLVKVVGGAFALYGLNLAAERILAVKRDLDLREQQERMARFVRASELLGTLRDGEKNTKEPHTEARVGAVHALAALARENSKLSLRAVRVEEVVNRIINELGGILVFAPINELLNQLLGFRLEGQVHCTSLDQ
jgi:hypothetical protein